MTGVPSQHNPNRKNIGPDSLSDRQKRAFIQMYEDRTVPVTAIVERFRISNYTITEYARHFNLTLRGRGRVL